MPRLLSVTATLLLLISGAVSQTAAQVQKAIGSIELPASHPCVPYKLTNKDKVYDVLKVLLQSDGKRITIAATLKDPPPARPGHVLGLYFDTDNNPKTGGRPFFSHEESGFELQSAVEACARYTNGEACGDGFQDDKVTAHYTIANLQRFTGPKPYEFDDDIISTHLFGFNATRDPIIGNMVHATFKYADLKVQSGQTIRILVERVCGDLGGA